MKKQAVLIFFILLVAQIFAMADEITIVDVRRNITLADEELPYKDFYLNAGEGSGLKKNLVVSVKRKIFVKDNGAKSVGDFETTVGQLRIIHVEGKVAVAREYKLQSRDEDPMLDQIGLMMGDRVDLTGAFTDNSKPKRKIATVEKPVETTPSIEPTDKVEEKKTASAQPIDQQDVKNPSAAPTAPGESSEPAREPATQLPHEAPPQSPALQAIPTI